MSTTRGRPPFSRPLLEHRFGRELVFADFYRSGRSNPLYARRRVEQGLENVVRVLSNGKTFPLPTVFSRVECHPARPYHDAPVDGWYLLGGFDLQGHAHKLLLQVPEQTGGMGGRFYPGEKTLRLFGREIHTSTLYHEAGHGLYYYLFQQPDRLALCKAFFEVSEHLLKKLKFGSRDLHDAMENLGMTWYGGVTSNPPKQYDHLYLDPDLVLQVISRKELNPEEAEALKKEGIKPRIIDQFSVLRKDPKEAFAESFVFYMRSRMLDGTGIPTRSIDEGGRAWYATVKRIIEDAVERSLV